VKRDTSDATQSFSLGFVSRKTTPGYTSPPGVEDKLMRDITTGRLEDEGALVLQFENFAPGEYALARRSLYQKVSFVNYNSVSLWVRSASGYKPKVILRFGSDSSNFYEYKFKVQSSDWHEIRVSLEELVRFKDSNPSGGYRSDGRIGVRGNPNIFDVKFFWIGIENDGDIRNSGVVWVNELRLTDPVTTSANAGKINVGFKLSSVLSINANGQIEQVDFAQSAIQRNNYDKRNYNISGTLNTHEFFPKSWGLNIPVTFGYNRSYQIPKYKPGSDVPIKNSSEKLSFLSTSTGKSFGWSFKKSNSRSLLGRLLIDPWNISNGFSSSSNLGPEVRDTSFRENYSVSYSYNPKVEIRLFNRLINLLPNYRIGYSYNRDFNRRFILGSQITTERKDGQLSGDINYNLVPGIFTVSYGFSRMGDYRFDSSLLGYEAGFGERYSGSLNIPQFLYVQPSFSYNHNYRENRSLEIRPSPNLDVRNLDENLDVQASFGIFHGQLLSKIGSLRDESRDTSLQTAGPIHTILYGIDKLSQFWNNLRVTYTFSRNSRYNLVERRANWRYRLGISNDPQAGISRDSFSNAWAERNAVDMNTGISFANVSLQPRYAFSRTLSYTKVKQSITKEARFPDLTVSIYNIPLPSSINLISSSNLNISLSRTNTFTHYPPTPPDSAYDKRITTNFSLSPNIILRTGSSINLNFTRSITEGENLLTFRSGSRDVQNNIDITASHTLNGFGGIRLPWSSGNLMSLRNQLILSMTFSINSSRSDVVNYTGEIPEWRNISDRIGNSLSISANYSFSNAVDATLVYSRGYSYDRKTMTGSRSNELRVDVRINF